MKKFIAIIACATFALFISGCKCDHAAKTCPPSVCASTLLNKTWTPVEVAGQGEIKTPSEGDAAYITFGESDTPEKSKVSGYGGDNGFFGTVEFSKDGKITFGPMAATLRLGQNSEYERVFLKALNESKEFKICTDSNGAETLVFKDAAGGLTVKFKEAEPKK